MTSTLRILPNSERSDPDHSFIRATTCPSPLFAGWGPKI
jgi:hypothetical protein